MRHQACSAHENTNGRSDLDFRLNLVRSEIDHIQGGLAAFTAQPMNSARALKRARALRNDYFDADLFADPAWEILLELYVCSVTQQRIAVSKIAFVLNIPSTTVLRWVATLVDRGLIIRSPDPTDGRRTWASLSSLGLQKMETYFATL